MKRLAALLILLLVSTAVSAEWLAFKDGTTRAIQGPWKIKGKQLIFKDMSGTLSTVRVDDVDLSASEQLSKNAAEDRGLVELKSAPTVAYDWETVSSGREVIPLSGGGSLIREWSVDIGKYAGVHPGMTCLPSRLVGASSGTEWWLQTASKIEKFRPLGLSWVDTEKLRALVPNGLLCVEKDNDVLSPDAQGRTVGYARLADGRDIGLELLKNHAARLNGETFSHRKDYQAAAQ